MDKVKAFIERGKDGIYSVYIDLENDTLNYGIHGTGNTIEEAIEDFEISYKDMKAFYKKIDKPFVEAEFSYHYDTASFLAYYSQFMSLAGMQRITGINQGQLSHYLNGHRKPSKKTAEKIQQKIHNFAEELHQVQFV